MYIVNVVNTECKYISIDNNIDIDISIDNTCMDWMRMQDESLAR